MKSGLGKSCLHVSAVEGACTACLKHRLFQVVWQHLIILLPGTLMGGEAHAGVPFFLFFLPKSLHSGTRMLGVNQWRDCMSRRMDAALHS